MFTLGQMNQISSPSLQEFPHDLLLLPKGSGLELSFVLFHNNEGLAKSASVA